MRSCPTLEGPLRARCGSSKTTGAMNLALVAWEEQRYRDIGAGALASYILKEFRQCCPTPFPAR
jgi:hypothetical protein